MNTDKLKNIEKDKMLPNPTTEETAEEAAQRANAKRIGANRESKKRKRTEESQQQRENRLAANRESMKRKRAEESHEQQENRFAAKERKTAQLDENPPGQRESKHIKTENDSDDDWVFELDKVINAYQILVKKTKVRRYVLHSDAEKSRRKKN